MLMGKNAMKLDHITLRVRDLTSEADFYCKYFNGTTGPEYFNSSRGFRSCFITFDPGAPLELMHMDSIEHSHAVSLGWHHVAFSVGSKERVNSLTERLRVDGHKIVSGRGRLATVTMNP